MFLGMYFQMGKNRRVNDSGKTEVVGLNVHSIERRRRVRQTAGLLLQCYVEGLGREVLVNALVAETINLKPVSILFYEGLSASSFLTVFVFLFFS